MQETQRKLIGFTEQDNSTDELPEIKRIFAFDFYNQLDGII
ncbi:MAG: hypothetical protein ACTS73_07110 [Arsenophonus sp. NEOnobi-MAG3]